MFFCKEKCGRIFVMKKFILALVLVVMVGMDAGVAWGVVLDSPGGAMGGGDTLSGSCQQTDCPAGQYFDSDDCVCKSVDFQESESDTCDAAGPEYEYKDGECVDLVVECATSGKVWVSEGKKCITGEEFCNSKNLKWDSATNSCRALDEQGTILPGTSFTETECEAMFTYDAATLGVLKDVVSGKKKDLYPKEFINGPSDNDKNVSPLDVLGCAIKTGRVSMWMIPFFVKYLIQFAISIAGLVAVGAIIIGGYFYLFSGLDNDKERGKKAIMYGLLGFIVVLLAWTIVNAAIGLLTR